MSVLGLDPSLTCTGWVILHDSGAVDAGAIRTQPVDKKLRIYAGDARFARLREIRIGLLEVIRRSRHSENLLAVHAEMPLGAKSNKAATALANMQGLLCGVETILSCHVKLHSPRAVKCALAGNRNASKQDMVAAVKTHSTTVDAAIQKLKTKAEREAAADAYGAILAGKMGIV